MPTEATGRPSVPEPSRSDAEDTGDPEFERIDDPEFEGTAERAEREDALDKELEDTFPTSDPPSSWAGKDPDVA